MKITLVIMTLIFSYVVVAQTDTEIPKNSKPSWSSRLPDRNDAPELDTEKEDDTGLSGLKMDRSALFNDDEDTSLVLDDNSGTTTPEESGKATALERQAEANKIAEQERQAEADRVAEQERQAEADRVAEQERQVEVARITEQNRQAEIAKLAEKKAQTQASKSAEQEAEADSVANQEKIAEEQKRAAEKRDIENTKIVKNPINTPENTQEVQTKPYTWKKIKNSLPEYPAKAARDGKEGWVDVKFTINNSGTVIGAHPVKTYKNSKLFNKAALRAVRHWKYDPPIKYGIKLNQTKTVRIVFNLAK